MKKIVSFIFIFSCFFSYAENIKQGDAVKKPCPKKYALGESVVAGASVSALTAALVYKLWQAGFLVAKKTSSLVLGEVIAIPLAFLSAFTLDAKYGIFPQKTASAFFKLGNQILLGDLANDKLFNKVLDLAEGSAINIINEIIEAYGFEPSEKHLKFLKQNLHKAREYLFDIIDDDSAKDLTKKELEQLPINREKVEKALKKIEATEKLVSFKKEFMKIKEAMLKGEIAAQSIFSDSNTVISDGSAQLAVSLFKDIERSKKMLLKKKRLLPYECISKNDFDDFIKKSGILTNKLKKYKK